MFLPVEPGRLIERPGNRGPDNRGCTIFVFRPFCFFMKKCILFRPQFYKSISALIRLLLILIKILCMTDESVVPHTPLFYPYFLTTIFSPLSYSALETVIFFFFFRGRMR